jgi:adenylosuccinate lyase
MTRGLLYSQRVLLALVDKGMQRDDAYRIVQEHAMAVWNGGDSSLAERLRADARVAAILPAADLEACFDPAYLLRNVDAIFERCGL